MRVMPAALPRDSQPPAAEPLSLRAVLGALRRRRLLIALTLLLVNGLALAAALMLTPRYTATATLLVEPYAGAPEGSAARAEARTADAALLPTQVSLLRSPALAAQVVTELGLATDPELAPGEPIADRLRGLLGSRQEPRVPGDALAVVPALLGRLSVTRQGESRILAVSYRSRDPAKAAEVANAVVRLHLANQLESRQDRVGSAERWVRERARELEQELRTAEATVSDYMERHGLARMGTSGPDAQQPPSLRRELATARAERATAEARLSQLEALRMRGDGFAALPEASQSVVVQNLQQQLAQSRAREAQVASVFGANHPSRREARSERENIERRLAAEIENVGRGIEGDVTRARARERELERLLDESVRTDIGSERAAIRLNELTRLVDTKSTQYRALLVRLEEIGEERGRTTPGVEMVAAATAPQQRDFPRLGVILGAGMAGSLVLALGLAALVEHNDRYLRAAHHVEALGLRNLGVVPLATRRQRREGLHRHLLSHPQSAYAEAIRGLHIAIERVPGEQPKQVLMVTSTLAGEGKTTLAASLAAMSAKRGRRTVIVDLDLRHPSVALQLGLPPHPGLLEYMFGRHLLHEVTQEVGGDPRLHAIALQGHVGNPGELLDSPRLRELIALLRWQYDTIVLDVPPALGITDAITVGEMADSVLFVTRWGATPNSAAAHGIAALEDAGVSIVGCVLTRVDLRRHAGYGYEDAAEYYRNYRKYFRQ